MLRNSVPIIMALAIVAGLFLFFAPKAQQPVAVEEPEAQEAVPPPVTKREPEKVVKKFAQTTVDTPKSLDAPLPPDVLTYEIKDGLGVVQGDIIIGQPEEQNTEEKGLYKMPIPNYWDKPEIPYVIHADVPRPEEVKKAIKHIEERTGVKFIPYDNQPDGIVFQKGTDHCLSALGRLGGMQPIRLTQECGWSEITHEIMHAFGFIHEHSRSDRDQYLNVLWDNIDPKYKSQFEIMSDAFLGPVKDTEFDYNSIMLYGKRFFGKTKDSVTLQSKTRTDVLPSSNGLTRKDAERVRKMFRLD